MTDKKINGTFLWFVAAHLQRNITSFPASKSIFFAHKHTEKKPRENEDKMEDVLLLHKF